MASIQFSSPPAAVLEVKALQTLRDMLGEDISNSILVEVIDIYLEEAPKQLQALREAVETNDLATLKAMAHTLKPTSATLGAIALSKLCRELEAMVQAQDTKEVLTLKVQQVLLEYERVKIALQAERNLCQL